MKNKHLLLLLFLPLLLVGCHSDGDVDFPKPDPQKPVSELIQGKWYNSSNDDIYYFNDGAVALDSKGIFFVPITAAREEQEENYEEAVDYGDYILTESGGKMYLELVDYSSSSTATHTQYLIHATSDTNLILEKQGGFGPDRLELIKQEYTEAPDKTISELIKGDWYKVYTIPARSPNASFMFPDTYSFIDEEHFNIYNEIYPEGTEFNYNLVQRNGNTYIDYYELYPPEGAGGTYTFEVVSISADKLTLKNLYDNSNPNHYTTMELIRK